MGANLMSMRLLVGLIVTFLLTACGSAPIPAPSATPVVSAAPSVAVATPPSTPTPTPSPAPTASPTPTPSLLTGARWTRVADQVAFADVGMAAVAASPEHYVAVGWTGKEPGAHGAAWISVDGRSWQRASIPSAENAAPRGIIYDRLGFVAWGYDTSAPTSRAAIWVSPDGMTWQRAPDIPSFAWVEITGIARLGEQLVAVGSNNEAPSFLAWTSADGLAWRPVSGTEGLSATPNALAATGTALVAPAGDQTVIRSTDGLQWEVVTSPKLGGVLEAIVGSSGRLVGVGTSPGVGGAGSPPAPATAWTSTDGRTWLRAALRPSALGWLHLVAAHGSEYVALGEGFGPTFAYRSTDGQTWTKMSTAPDTTREGRVAEACTGGPCSYRSVIYGLADGPLGPVAVGRTELKSGSYQAVVWTLR